MTDFSQYTTEYISGVMSLREPQKISLEILADIINLVNPKKNMDLEKALEKVSRKYSSCTDFERSFMSLTFALATGVGKTRLMGAFIAYLYTQCGIKNFFVVAPSTTIYDKLKSDLSNPESEKYVFQGLGCFTGRPPEIIKDDDYRNRSGSVFPTSDARIFIFNIDKFNRETTNMNKVNEYLGESFYNYLAGLDDLVLIMDESHHYRAQAGFEALNNLKPLMGLELTATPYVTSASRQIPFKNVVYRYGTAEAINAGFLRIPYAMYRANLNPSGFGDAELDRVMLEDGINHHERIKDELWQYAIDNRMPDNPLPVVKPFMLVVCKDTEHAERVKNFICSDEFKNGRYTYKTIVVHSRQSSAELEKYTRLLLDVERPDNPVEIVIHVNKLKEGWDVNNLYTIVPLRTATSKILREQMVGRGLRLPYGKQTKVKNVDSVMLTAHDNFRDIIADAQNGGIFKPENVVGPDDTQKEKTVCTQLAIKLNPAKEIQKAFNNTQLEKTPGNSLLLKTAAKMIAVEVNEHIHTSSEHTVSPADQEEIVEKVAQNIAESGNLTDLFAVNKDAVVTWMAEETKEINDAMRQKFIPIPEIKSIQPAAGERCFKNFDLMLSGFNHTPVDNKLYIMNLIKDINDDSIVLTPSGDIDFSGHDPKKDILRELTKKAEINYEKDKDLLFKLITQVCEHYERQYGPNGMRNIVVFYKSDIGDEIYMQMMNNFSYSGNIVPEEKVVGIRKYNLPHAYRFSDSVMLNENFTGDIRSTLFTDIKKGVWSTVKFDSAPELDFARILERDPDVLNWFKPAKNEFRMTYHDADHRTELYIPDFVVETEDTTFLVEVKGEHMLNNPDVRAKKAAGIRYCAKASDWCEAAGYKKWKYVLIPSAEIMPNSTFMHLARQFVCEQRFIIQTDYRNDTEG